MSARSGTETRASEDRSDSRRAHPDAKLAELALDPHTAPSRVLTRQAQHKLTERGIERRPTRQAAAIRPLPGDELSVPAQQRLRRNQEHRPTLPRKQRTDHRQQQPIPPPQRRPPHRPPQHPQLVTQHRILQLQHGNRPTPAKRPQQSPNSHVHQEEEHRWIVRTAKRDRESGFPPPYRVRSAAATGSAASSTSTTEQPLETRHEYWRPSPTRGR